MLAHGQRGIHRRRPNGSVCADDYLVRIGFMGPDSTSAFIEHAIAQGLTRFEPDGSAADFVTVDQVVGILSPCEWLIVGSVDHEGHQIRVARWVGDESPYIIFPEKWSLEQHLHFGNARLQPENPPSHFEFIREDDGLYLFEDTKSGQDVWTTERIERKSSKVQGWR